MDYKGSLYDENKIGGIVERAYSISKQLSSDCKFILMDLADYTSAEDQDGFGFVCYNDNGDYRVRAEFGGGWDESLDNLDEVTLYDLVDKVGSWY